MAPSKKKAAGTKGGMKQGTLFSFFSKAAKKPSAKPSAASSQKPSAPPPAAAAPKKNASDVPNGELLQQVQIGGRVEVYWSDDEEWYTAVVRKRRENSSKVYLEYESDGQCEWIDLGHESFRMADPSQKKKRRIQESDDDEENEFEMTASSSEEEDEGSEFEAEGDDNLGDEEDDFIVSDSDDEEIAKGKAKKKQKTTAGASSTSASSKKKQSAPTTSSSNPPRSRVSLGQFAAGAVTVTHHAAAAAVGKTPVSRNSSSLSASSRKSVITPSQLSMSSASRSQHSNAKETGAAAAKPPPPPPFTENVVNPAGSHVHNHLRFLQNPRDAQGRPRDHPDYDPRTLRVVESDWLSVNKNKKMSPGTQQWWDLKAQYFDTVLLFKTGKFYEMFHMDADVGVQVCGLIYMKGAAAHAGFPEISYGVMADKLVRAGYKVARVEQTETPEQLKVRKSKKSGSGPSTKVVNREVCSVLTIGTRTFCYLDDEKAIANEASAAAVGPLLAIREVLLDTTPPAEAENADDENVQPVCEYGVTLIDAVRGSVTIGQFADDVLRSRMMTLLSSFSPSEILLEGGEDGASPTLLSLLRGLQKNSQQNFCMETIRPTESFPRSTALDASVRKQLERGTSGRQSQVHPWDVEETLNELHRRKYYPRASKQQADQFSVKRWPPVLRAAVEGEAALALSSFGAALYYLQRNLIDGELLSLGIVKAYIPPESSAVATEQAAEIHQLALQQNMQESGLDDSSPNGPRGESSAPSENGSASMDIDQPETLDVENEVTHMSLDGTTLHNLEILTNSVDHKVAGSLWSKINYTKTPHGSRLLRAWLLRPLFRKADIDRRADAVQELVSGGAAVALKEARSVLSKCGDIERLLSRVHSMSGSGLPGEDGDGIHPNERAILYETATYTKRKVGDFSKVLNGLRCVVQIPELFDGIEIESGLLRKIVKFVDQGGCFPDMAEELDWFFSNFDCDQAAKGLFEPTIGIDDLFDESVATIERIIAELDDYKDEMCANHLTPRSQARSSWKYANLNPESKDKYLIELPASVVVPEDFIMKGKRGQGHKQINKYRTPVVEQLVQELERAYDVQKERKEKGMELIFAKFDSKRALWASAAQATALLDAIGALAQTAAKNGFTRPRILDCPPGESPCVNIVQGRHPCVENTFSSSEFIPNDVSLGRSMANESASPSRVLLLSGPNMGGKSTLLRQTCLITILAQLGSFVPADDCELTPIDRIFTRLGARDSILTNRSTFFVELAEMAAALRGATRRSLVIMDELGRGTSTHDGTAIASATVKHLIERSKCLTLFATHYHSLLDEWKEHENVLLGHMECLVENKTGEDNDEKIDDSNITFLYTLGPGVCPKSFGINVARMAGLPEEVLGTAKRASSEFEQEMSSVKASRSVVTARNAVAEKNRIMEALQNKKFDDMEAMWDALQEM